MSVSHIQPALFGALEAVAPQPARPHQIPKKKVCMFSLLIGLLPVNFYIFTTMHLHINTFRMDFDPFRMIGKSA